MITTLLKTIRLSDVVFKYYVALMACVNLIFVTTFTLNAQVDKRIDYSDRAEVENMFDMAGQDVFWHRFPSEHLAIEDEVTKFDQAGKGGYWHAAGTQELRCAVGDTLDGNLYHINLENVDVPLLTIGHRPSSLTSFTSEAHSHHSISPDGEWLLFK